MSTTPAKPRAPAKARTSRNAAPAPVAAPEPQATDPVLAAQAPPPKPGRYREPTPPAIAVEEFRKVVTTRRSVRKFTDRAIPPEVLHDCIDLALLAPNSSNLQPWGVYVVKSPAKKKAMVAACMGQNAAKTAAELVVIVARRGTFLENARQNLNQWPSALPLPKLVRDYYQKLVPLYYSQGPLDTLGHIKRNFFKVAGQFRAVPRGPFSDADMRVWAVKSAALAAENFMLALRAYGFDSCAMEGFDAERVNKLLKLPKDAEVVMVVGCGERTVDGVYYPQIRFERERFVFEV